MYYYLLHATAEIILIAAGGYPDSSFRILPSPRALHLSTTGRLASPNNEINTTSQIMRSPAVGKRSAADTPPAATVRLYSLAAAAAVSG
jgi:hypothetical protein